MRLGAEPYLGAAHGRRRERGGGGGSCVTRASAEAIRPSGPGQRPLDLRCFRTNGERPEAHKVSPDGPRITALDQPMSNSSRRAFNLLYRPSKVWSHLQPLENICSY
jgi:hypothetical protein